MKICMLAYTIYESDNRVRLYAESLVEQGYAVDAIVVGKKGTKKKENLNGVGIHRIKERLSNKKNKFAFLKDIIVFFVLATFFLLKSPRKYDIIHVHSVPDFLVFVVFIHKLLGAKIILDIHDIVPEFYADKFKVKKTSIIFKSLIFIEKLSCAISDHVIVGNEIWKKRLLKRSINSKNKCTALINYPNEKLFYKFQKNVNKEKFIALYPGSLNYHQGLDVAILAFNYIVKEIKNIQFHIYGEGGRRKELEILIRENKLDEIVIFKNLLPITDIAKKMADASIGIIPKRAKGFGNEAFSTKSLQFLALGVPIVMSNTMIDKYYFNEDTVRFFNSEDSKDLAEKVIEVLKNENLKKNLIKNGLNYVKNNTWQKKRDTYFNIIKELIIEKNFTQ